MKCLIVLALVAACCAQSNFLQTKTPIQTLYHTKINDYIPEHKWQPIQSKRPWTPYNQWTPYIHTAFQGEQWTPLYHLHVTEFYKHGVRPMIEHIRPQLAEHHTWVLDTLIHELSYPFVEILCNVITGHMQFSMTHEHYLELVRVMQQVGYEHVEEMLNHLVGEKFWYAPEHVYLQIKYPMVLSDILEQLRRFVVIDEMKYLEQYQGKYMPYPSKMGLQWHKNMPMTPFGHHQELPLREQPWPLTNMWWNRVPMTKYQKEYYYPEMY